jgi:hypothetical protein
MNIAEARKHGYEIMRGAYAGTFEDNRTLWYITKLGESWPKIHGFPTRRAALAKLAEQLEEIRFNGQVEYWYSRAALRVEFSPELSKYSEIIMKDFPGREHWEWVSLAKIEVIVEWAKNIQNVIVE